MIGAVGLVFSFYKAVRSFFSSDYKKEQQRKSADENIEKVFEKLTEMLDGNLESASAKINEALISTKTQMRIPLRTEPQHQSGAGGIHQDGCAAGQARPQAGLYRQPRLDYRSRNRLNTGATSHDQRN